MRFFSKFTFICNLFFIPAVILRSVEIASKNRGSSHGAIPLQLVESTLVVLGYGAIVVNFIFLLCILILALLKRKQPTPRWLIWGNLVFFVAQFIYFDPFSLLN